MRSVVWDGGRRTAMVRRRAVNAYADDEQLARSCARDDASALAAFEARFSADLRRVHASARTTKVSLEDFLQGLRLKLFVARPPKILEYAATGPLRAWVRTVATRTLLDMARPAHLNERATDDALLEVPAPSDDPDLAYLKRLYGAATKAALRDAARTLSPEERNVLREHYARALSIDQIAALHGCHRATAARRIERARERLLGEVRVLLREKLGISERSLESVLRLVKSDLHVTLDRVLS
jgi:RNA polymerase sigma-70 factor (ECF subfamily)